VSSAENTTAPQPRRQVAYCSWHKGLSDTARLVGAHEEATGPGGNLFACEPCRESYGLVPLADRPL
jgi:hypothetical protein